MWIDILRSRVAESSARQVARELGVAHSTVVLVCQGQYPAGTARIEERIRKIYGNESGISCPVLGLITPILCAEKWALARKIGMKAGNPETLRLYKECMRCSVRR